MHFSCYKSALDKNTEVVEKNNRSRGLTFIRPSLKYFCSSFYGLLALQHPTPLSRLYKRYCIYNTEINKIRGFYF